MSGTDETRRNLRDIISGGREPTRSIEARVHAVGCSGLRTISIRGFRLNSGEGDHVAGFDLGPGPDEHFLGALGASIAQAVSTVACSHDLPIDRVDVNVQAAISLDQSPAHFVGIDVHVRIESSDPPAAFDGIDAEILMTSVIASALHVPIELTLDIVPLASDRVDADHWQI